MLSYKPSGGKRVRRYYKTRKQAERERTAQERLLAKAGEAWLAMTTAERDELVELIGRAQRCGFTLREAVESYESDSRRQTAAHGREGIGTAGRE